ncbi:MAG TPA: formyltetrahydrofolate deformylase [Nocardioides sp.]|uniref:formyltetrahydrofolate deformylase n=1 Tax=Nocardioides sp. TaxID=35761 RepID=UPI002C30A7AE|nr:formyltetrahydrofolate deformylase [Nocardioides sp.]HQR26884.1 formyltetrahydrofolate deformylase [Nocardioides sp.]
MPHYVLTLQCPDRPGIVLALATGIGRAGGTILDSAQFSDPTTGLFCVRTEFEAPAADAEELRALVGAELAAFGARLSLRPRDRHRRALLMVSRLDHCLVDLLYRWERGELPVEIPVVVSNHEDLRELVERHGLEYVHVPVTPATKPAAEARLLELVEDHRIDVVVLARYMQVLSDEACRRLAGRAINIHHSFLPGFKGARPYHQAHDRGVKLIGATAHYVTGDLDEGPIIEQDVVRVGHTRTAEQMVRLGRDVERLVLARAVTAHAEDRVFLCGARTVVFAD